MMWRRALVPTSRAPLRLRRQTWLRRCSSHALPAAVDVETYPLHDASRSRALLEKCRGEIRATGYCHLPGFLRADAAKKLCKEFEALEQKNLGFRSFEAHNVYLEDRQVPSDASEARAAASAEPEVDLRDKEFSSSKLLVAQDALPKDSDLLAIYNWRPLQDFLQNVFSLHALYPSADPFGGVYYNLFDGAHQDALGWHFDRSKFSMNLILQTAKGGDFQYIQDSRPAIDRMTYWSEVETFIADKTETPKLMPGSLYLFAGNRSLHRVSPVTEGRRVNAILTYFETPGQTLNEYTLRKFFGRSHTDCS
eukprot:TRINITY_DN27084_c0_g1_i1.p1 TRINITY_DN27084_c0_g1~~TRINITY_DN27084_c0_g1_i1.p1  ORF type:complete len:319 (+),score=53.62 TRINITY_DN27084_c0_g1_i1:34-957(+)